VHPRSGNEGGRDWWKLLMGREEESKIEVWKAKMRPIMVDRRIKPNTSVFLASCFE
jgi:hypothetical protein